MVEGSYMSYVPRLNRSRTLSIIFSAQLSHNPVIPLQREYQGCTVTPRGRVHELAVPVSACFHVAGNDNVLESIQVTPPGFTQA